VKDQKPQQENDETRELKGEKKKLNSADFRNACG
jgi:hypothetical protein